MTNALPDGRVPSGDGSGRKIEATKTDTLRQLCSDDTFRQLSSHDTLQHLSSDDTVRHLSSDDTLRRLSSEDTVRQQVSSDDTVGGQLGRLAATVREDFYLLKRDGCGEVNLI